MTSFVVILLTPYKSRHMLGLVFFKCLRIFINADFLINSPRVKFPKQELKTPIPNRITIHLYTQKCVNFFFVIVCLDIPTFTPTP